MNKIPHIFLSILFTLNLVLTQNVRSEGTAFSGDTQNKEESLLSLIDSVRTDSAKISIYLQLIKLLRENAPAKAEKYLETVEALTRNDTLSAERILYLKEAGTNSMDKGNYDKASAYYIRGLNLAERTNRKLLVKDILNNLAILNMKTHSIKKGIEYFEKLVQMAEEENNKKDWEESTLNLSLAYANSGQEEKAKENLLHLFALAESKFIKAVAANSLSYIYLNFNQYNKSCDYGKTAVDLAGEINNRILELEAMTNYGNALRMLKRSAEAEKIMLRILKTAKANKLREQYVNTLGNLALLYEDGGNYKKSLKFEKEYSDIKDSLLNENVTKQINELQIKYETEKKDKELSIKDAAIEKQSIIIRYTLAIAITFIIFFIVVFILYGKKQRAYHKITDMHVNAIKKEEKEKKKFAAEKREINKNRLSGDTVEQLYEELERKIQEEKLFTQKELTLGKLAGELNISAKYISQVVHKKYGVSFPDFINNLRVKEAAKLLIDPAYENFSVEGIADISGFKSRSVFNYSFKKFMGVTPSFYKESAKKILRQDKDIAV